MESALGEVIFTRLEGSPKLFFDILPDEWSIDIAPVWSHYEKNSSIYVVKYNEKIIGGGILFSTLSPDTKYYDAPALSKLKTWFDDGYGYIAYFYISDQYRGKGIGIKWLNELIALNASKGLFLTIEDDSLIGFYKKAGFNLQDEINFEDNTEWLLVRGEG
ncbi:GNAT family N-acetyltransferase [Chondrinema litorale]|uniref:GNAT family N-acetyltransferase n=1 Tax=Chondrinema litorale TaxID=2994555 RepID=UPI002543EEFD|nr:GNAT family N-acetyltransferase [Chondrinema litorale]UZR96374.1 GNAT family N-acetyltransferase [Chondrinema litorale]